MPILYGLCLSFSPRARQNVRMDVREVKPNGYCRGVMDAIKLAIEAQENNKDKTCYLLGGIVHNEGTIGFFKSKGFVLLDEKTAPLDVLLESVPEGQVVIFSAHGHARNLEKIAERKNLIVYDATCPFVTANMRMAEHAKGRDVIYVGAKGHAEAVAFLANESTAAFFDANGKTLELHKENIENPLVIGQTTLSKEEFDEGYEAVLNGEAPTGADMNGDGKVNLADVIYMLRQITR